MIATTKIKGGHTMLAVNTTITESVELIPVEVHQLTPAELFKPETISQIVEKIKQLSTEAVPDLTTPTGRKKVASLANKVARSKTFLDNAGKQLVATWKEQAKAVDIERKKMRDSLDTLKEQVRRPLTKWEAAETVRLTSIRERMQDFEDVPEIYENSSAVELAGHIARLEKISLVGLDEFAEVATLKKQVLILSLQQRLNARKRYETDQAEIQRLKKEAAERDAENARLKAEKERADREERIAKDAANRALKEAEAQARAQAAKVEAEKQAAITKQREAEEEVERMKQQRIADEAAAEKREIDRVANDKRVAAEAEQTRLSDIAQAEERERSKIANAQAKAKADEAARQADEAHREAVNEQVAASLHQVVGVGKEAAQEVVRQAASGAIPNLIIIY
jgi:hypothetical protein